MPLETLQAKFQRGALRPHLAQVSSDFPELLSITDLTLSLV